MHSVRKIAERYGLSEALVRSMAREGVLPGDQEGGRWQMDEEAVEILDDLVEPREESSAAGEDDDDTWEEGEDDGDDDEDDD